MRRIVDYRIVSGTYANIAGYVKNSIYDGWQPFGSPTWFGDNEDTGESWFAQAMVRYDTEGESHETD